MSTITSARQIGQAIRSKRKALSLTQQQLADAAHVSRGFIARIEKGTSTAVYPDKLIDVLDKLGLTLMIEDTKANNSKTDHALFDRSLTTDDADFTLDKLCEIANSEATMKAAEISRTIDSMIPDYIRNFQIDTSLLNSRGKTSPLDYTQESSTKENIE